MGVFVGVHSTAFTFIFTFVIATVSIFTSILYVSVTPIFAPLFTIVFFFVTIKVAFFSPTSYSPISVFSTSRPSTSSIFVLAPFFAIIILFSFVLLSIINLLVIVQSPLLFSII